MFTLTKWYLDLVTDDGRAVEFSESRDLRNRAVAANLSPVAPTIRRRLIGSLGGMHEHKLLSRSVLTSANDGTSDQGWAIHEDVTWSKAAVMGDQRPPRSGSVIAIGVHGSPSCPTWPASRFMPPRCIPSPETS